MKGTAAAFLSAITRSDSAETPLYRQVYESFRRAIIDGRIRAGQRVPSSRALAAELRISRIPIISAYEQLVAEGYFETIVGAGTYVSRSIPDETPRTPTKTRGAFGQLDAGRGARRTSRRVGALPVDLSLPWLQHAGAFRVSQPALDHFPIHTWSKLLSRHYRAHARNLMAYGDPMGYMPLREAIADYLRAVRGVRCDSSQLLVTNGSQQALQIAALVLLDPSHTLCIEEPGYLGARQAFLSTGARLAPVRVDEDGIDVQQLIRRRQAPRAVYVTPSHQYPLGSTMSAGRRITLLKWASRSGVWIIEDDYDSEYRFGSRPITSLQGLDEDGRVIYVGTFSKVMFPALRMGYVVVPKDLIVPFAAARDAVDMFSSTLTQAVLADFIREGHLGRHIRRMRMLYTERRDALLRAINAHIPDGFTVIGAQAGMHLVALLPDNVNDLAVSTRAAEMGVSATPLSGCYLTARKKPGLILGYGGADVEQLQAATRKLKTCLRAGTEPLNAGSQTHRHSRQGRAGGG